MTETGWRGLYCYILLYIAILLYCYIAMWSKQRWPPRYKRHNFCDWDRMAWAPELQPRPKWFQMIAISRQRAQTESAAYLYTKCYETIPILPQICHFMRLALLNWGAQKLCPFSNTFFHFRPRKGFSPKALKWNDLPGSLEIILRKSVPIIFD